MSAPCLERLASFGSLLAAFRKARRAKRGKGGEPAFFADLEENLLRLSRELRKGAFVPSEYRRFRLWTGKERLVAEAAFRDRVVHHALVAELERAFEPRFSPHSFACRRGLGTHAALARAREGARGSRYALRLDVSRFFESTRHDVLRGLLREGLETAGAVDEELLDLCDRILAVAPTGTGCPPGVGLPIGNLTSQFWANVVLDPVDRAVEGAGWSTWSRYMDDMLAFSDDKRHLWALRDRVAALVEGPLGLVLKPRATRVLPVTEGVPWLGFQVFPGTVRLDASGRRRLGRRLRACARRVAEAEARGDHEGVEREAARARGTLGHAMLGDTLALRRSILRAIDG